MNPSARLSTSSLGIEEMHELALSGMPAIALIGIAEASWVHQQWAPFRQLLIDELLFPQKKAYATFDEWIEYHRSMTSAGFGPGCRQNWKKHPRFKEVADMLKAVAPKSRVICDSNELKKRFHTVGSDSTAYGSTPVLRLRSGVLLKTHSDIWMRHGGHGHGFDILSETGEAMPRELYANLYQRFGRPLTVKVSVKPKSLRW